MRPESALESYFQEQAEKHGFLQYKFLSGVTGVPDRIIIGNGVTAFVESQKWTVIKTTAIRYTIYAKSRCYCLCPLFKRRHRRNIDKKRQR